MSTKPAEGENIPSLNEQYDIKSRGTIIKLKTEPLFSRVLGWKGATLIAWILAITLFFGFAKLISNEPASSSQCYGSWPVELGCD